MIGDGRLGILFMFWAQLASDSVIIRVEGAVWQERNGQQGFFAYSSVLAISFHFASQESG